MKPFLQKHKKAISVTGTILAVGIAALYYFVFPVTADSSSLMQQFIAQYAHPVCWLILAAACFGYYRQWPRKVISILLYSALLLYLLFITIVVS